MTENEARVKIDQLRQDTSLSQQDKILPALILIAELLLEIRLKQADMR